MPNQTTFSKRHKTLTLHLTGHAYDIHIGGGVLSHLDSLIPFSLEKRKIFLLTDKNVEALYAHKVHDHLKTQGALVTLLTIKGGEASKSFADFERLSHEILCEKATRDSLLIALGGGVVGDLGGFLASTIVRGIPYIQVPTTLLAQVDSSVGGKTAINTPFGKNLLGTFYQPHAVVIDLETLKTLPSREYRAGLAEVVKYGLINDVSFFDYLEEHIEALNAMDMERCQEIVFKSCQAKANIVRQDEKETSGVRAILNLGHTFGHALEAIAGYNGDVLHGEAVSVGMVMAAHVSCDLGVLPLEDVERITRLLRALKLPVSLSDLGMNINLEDFPQAMYECMQGDKKATKEGIGFVLFDGEIGQVTVRSDLSEDFVIKQIKKCIELDQNSKNRLSS